MSEFHAPEMQTSPGKLDLVCKNSKVWCVSRCANISIRCDEAGRQLINIRLYIYESSRGNVSVFKQSFHLCVGCITSIT